MRSDGCGGRESKETTMNGGGVCSWRIALVAILPPSPCRRGPFFFAFCFVRIRRLNTTSGYCGGKKRDMVCGDEEGGGSGGEENSHDDQCFSLVVAACLDVESAGFFACLSC